MEKQTNIGIFQLENGFWAYRYTYTENGKRISRQSSKDQLGNPLKNKSSAIKARKKALSELPKEENLSSPKPIIRKTVKEVYLEYCENGRSGKAYNTIIKQDSLWKNHISAHFGNRYIDTLKVAEINDYLDRLYYIKGHSYRYVESFLKMFYLILGQAYSRNYLDVDIYNKLCINKTTKIHMPKLKANDSLEIVAYSKEEIELLDNYFRSTNAETAFLLGRYCGLRINECYGLKWENIDLNTGTILIDRQMQYQSGLIKLVPLKTLNAKRTLYMCDKLKLYFKRMIEQRKLDEMQYSKQREQNRRMIEDLDGSVIFSTELVNCLPNGKIQTVNSMKYHAKEIEHRYNIKFKYHFLRHSYGTIMAELNTPSYLLCNQMGHGKLQVTQQYYLAISKTGIDILRNNLNHL